MINVDDKMGLMYKGDWLINLTEKEIKVIVINDKFYNVKIDKNSRLLFEDYYSLDWLLIKSGQKIKTFNEKNFVFHSKTESNKIIKRINDFLDNYPEELKEALDLFCKEEEIDRNVIEI